MKRAGRSGLRRNAAVAMGNRADQAYTAALERARESDDPVVSSHADWSLERLAGDHGRVRKSPEIKD